MKWQSSYDLWGAGCAFMQRQKLGLFIYFWSNILTEKDILPAIVIGVLHFLNIEKSLQVSLPIA